MSLNINIKLLIERANNELVYKDILDVLMQDMDTMNLFIQTAWDIGYYTGAFDNEMQSKYYNKFMKIVQENDKIKKILNALCEDSYPYLFNGKRFFTTDLNFPKAGEAPTKTRSKSNWTTKMYVAGNFATVMGNTEKGQERKAESAPGTSGIVVFTQDIPKEKVILDVENFKKFMIFIVSNIKDKIVKAKAATALKQLQTVYGPYGEPDPASDEGEIVTEPIQDIKVLASYKVLYDKENAKIDFVSDVIDLKLNSKNNGREEDSSQKIIDHAKQNSVRFSRGLEDAKKLSFGHNKFINKDLTIVTVSPYNGEPTKEQIKQLGEKYKNQVEASINKTKQEIEDKDIMDKPDYHVYNSELKGKRIKRFLELIKDKEELKNVQSMDDFTKFLFNLKNSDVYEKERFSKSLPSQILDVLNQSFLLWIDKNAPNYENVNDAFEDFKKEIENKYFPNIFKIFNGDEIKKKFNSGYNDYIIKKFKKPAKKAPQEDDAWRKYLPTFKSKEWNKGKTEDQLRSAILSWMARQPR